MYEKILVPLDGSIAAEIALPYAEEIAARLGSEIILVRVFEASPPDAYRSYLENITERVKRQLVAFQANEGAKVCFEVLLGKPATEILHCADKSSAGLIVMASRGASGEGPWLLGNIAAKVLQAAQCPVLLIRTPVKAGAFQQKKLIKRILVPLDGSKLGEAAISCVETLAQTLNAELVLFQVIEPPMTTRAVPQHDINYEALQEYERQTKPLALAYLDGVAKSLKDKGINAQASAGFGYPADQIIDYAQANAIDIIAMSTHGRSGIGKWVFGSVTEKVLQAGDMPVLVVRAKGA